ncbi:DUF1441 family protein [Rodentibacter pneumotropicus]|uniref:DUF1441 family protein n=1 Tax=Rodentibacter pneumotropicus TaxID=758 RepID=UPI00109C0F14|nr:DUF1441 family protein [Rodentibacter pneumotropicus]THA00325.1 DUF1441 family protein [Rodentibacter pneumotropicus]
MENLFDLKLNINQIAEVVGMHRQTASNRLSRFTPATGSNAKNKLYFVRDLITAALEEQPEKMSKDVDELPPMERRAWFQSENERLRFEKEMGELIPAFEVAQQMSALAKYVVQHLETLPDILERDCGLPPNALIRVQQIIDDLRDQTAQHIQEDDLPEDE